MSRDHHVIITIALQHVCFDGVRKIGLGWLFVSIISGYIRQDGGQIVFSLFMYLLMIDVLHW